MTSPPRHPDRPIRIGIDGSNLRAGGGVTHLREMLAAVRPDAHGVEKVTVWGARRLLDALTPAPWLTLRHEPALESRLPARLWWQSRSLAAEAASACDVLFCPGGHYSGRFRPFVTMSRNLLLFQREERRRYARLSWRFSKLELLRFGQIRTLRRAAGVIYPTEFVRRMVEADVGVPARGVVIPYGVGPAFFRAPRPQSVLGRGAPYRLLYVSTVDLYKHQWHVVDAVAGLRRSGLLVTLDLVGHAYPPALERLNDACRSFDPDGTFVRYGGPVDYADLPAKYHAADAFVFASSCESMSNVLQEAMAAGLPIACARRGPLPEVLGAAGTYFDPEDPGSIARALLELMESPERRAALAAGAYARARAQTWARCADETFQFIREVCAAPAHLAKVSGGRR